MSLPPAIFAQISRMSRSGSVLVLVAVLFASCSQNNVNEDASLKKYFDAAGVGGSFGLFDNGQGSFTIYNLLRFRDSAQSPAGTFDIVQSLIAIQTGVVKDDTALIATTASTGEVGSCGGELSLRQAFQNSCENGFGQLARRIGKDTLKKWIDSLGYGNKDMSGGIDTFWLNNRLKVTADEQLGLMKKLYFDQLPFYQHTQQVVRRMMQKEGNANYTLSYKTASGLNGAGHASSWLLGWIEENKHPYFFVLNLEAPGPDQQALNRGMGILHSILQQEGFFQGKK